MKVLIHACPRRRWYVERFLYPSLRDQGIPAEDISIWCDVLGNGNLISCMESFAARTGDGGTWHLQDDVLICRDFRKRCEAMDEGVVYGFCCERFEDDPGKTGLVPRADGWHSFQCVRIPDVWARECAEWFYTDARHRFIFSTWAASGKCDDMFFRAFIEDRHPDATIMNAAPNLVEHVDWLIGGSVISDRAYTARSDLWEDDDLLEELRQKLAAPA